MILVFGTICLDRIRLVPFLPAPGGYVSIQKEEIRLGGEAANTAYALAGWGAPYVLSGNSVEREVEGMMAAHGLSLTPQPPLPEGEGEKDTRQPPLPKGEVEPRAPICDIYVTPDGQRTMFGAGFYRMASTIDLSAIPFTGGGWFTMDMNFGRVGMEVAERAKAAGMKLYLMDVPPDDADELLGEGDFWQSSTDWHGTRGDTKRNLAWVEKKAKEWGATVILTDSGRELTVGLPNGEGHALPTFPPPLAKSGGIGRLDSTGAGDRFRAGMLLGLHEGWKLGECLAYACAASAMKVAHTGAIAPVPTQEQVVAFRKRHSRVDAAFNAVLI